MLLCAGSFFSDTPTCDKEWDAVKQGKLTGMTGHGGIMAIYYHCFFLIPSLTTLPLSGSPPPSLSPLPLPLLPPPLSLVPLPVYILGPSSQSVVRFYKGVDPNGEDLAPDITYLGDYY